MTTITATTRASAIHHPELSAYATARLNDMIAYAAQVTAGMTTDFEVTDTRFVAVPDLVLDGGRNTLVYRAELTGPSDIHYRVRWHEDRAAVDWEARMSLHVVTGEDYLENEIDVHGPISHAAARRAALNYARIMASYATTR